MQDLLVLMFCQDLGAGCSSRNSPQSRCLLISVWSSCWSFVGIRFISHLGRVSSFGKETRHADVNGVVTTQG